MSLFKYVGIQMIALPSMVLTQRGLQFLLDFGAEPWNREQAIV